jgi:hypothetical protein
MNIAVANEISRIRETIVRYSFGLCHLLASMFAFGGSDNYVL